MRAPPVNTAGHEHRNSLDKKVEEASVALAPLFTWVLEQSSFAFVQAKDSMAAMKDQWKIHG